MEESVRFPFFAEDVDFYDIPKGWWNIFKGFCEEASKVKVKFQIVQIKEKYGELDLFVSPYIEELQGLISEVVHSSKYTCCKCGKQPKDSRGRHIIWDFSGMLPLCKKCAKEHFYDWPMEKDYSPKGRLRWYKNKDKRKAYFNGMYIRRVVK